MRERILPITINGQVTTLVLDKRKFRAGVMNLWESMRFMKGDKIASATVGDLEVELLVEGERLVRCEHTGRYYDDTNSDVIEGLYGCGAISQYVLMKKNSFILKLSRTINGPDGSTRDEILNIRPYTEKCRNEKEFSEIFVMKAESLIKEIQVA